MNSELLQQLKSRMPELEWQLGRMGAYLPVHSLPKGLFRYQLEAGASFYIDEIKADIARLASQHNSRAAIHLAQLIRQKIDVLVMVCHHKKREGKPEERVAFNLNSLSTRQQWLRSLEATIDTLTSQRDALMRALTDRADKVASQALLSLQAEAGAAEKRLTLAQETYARAVGSTE